MKKILSIIIPVYNRKSVTLAIESVCRIKRPEIELIIIDGKSTDGTVECIKKYKTIQKMYEEIEKRKSRRNKRKIKRKTNRAEKNQRFYLKNLEQ